MEAFIHNNASVVQSPPAPPPQGHQQQQQQTSTNLPESPPDSGSEPPYSPNNVLHKISNLNRNIQLGISDLNDHQTNNQNLTMEHLTQQQNLSLSTLTELVPHHHLLTSASEIYLANEHHQQQQQLLQINSLLQTKNDGNSLLSHHQQQPDHMLLYQVNQSGQIIELNHIHQQQTQMNNRGLYKNDDMLELDNSGTLPAIQDIQQSLSGNSSSNLNDNLQMINDNFTRNALSTQTSQSVHDVTSNQHLAATSSSLLNTNSTSNSSTTVKKRKSSSHGYHPDNSDNLKAFIKSESSKKRTIS